jgi:hypothetical protein
MSDACEMAGLADEFDALVKELQQARDWQASLNDAYQYIVNFDGDRTQKLFWHSLIEALCKALTGDKNAIDLDY